MNYQEFRNTFRISPLVLLKRLHHFSSSSYPLDDLRYLWGRVDADEYSAKLHEYVVSQHPADVLGPYRTYERCAAGTSDDLLFRITAEACYDGAPVQEFEDCFGGSLRDYTEALMRLRDEPLPPSVDQGICYNLFTMISGDPSSYLFVAAMSLGWEHHAGDRAYMVPATSKRWEGDGLRLRKELCEYILKKLKLINQYSV